MLMPTAILLFVSHPLLLPPCYGVQGASAATGQFANEVPMAVIHTPSLFGLYRTLELNNWLDLPVITICDKGRAL
jgi:hypothetical protein